MRLEALVGGGRAATSVGLVHDVVVRKRGRVKHLESGCSEHDRGKLC